MARTHRDVELVAIARDPLFLMRHAESHKQDARARSVDPGDQRRFFVSREIAVLGATDIEAGHRLAHRRAGSRGDTGVAAEQEQALLLRCRFTAQQGEQVGPVEIVADPLTCHARGNRHARTIGQQGIGTGQGAAIGRVALQRVDAMRVDER